MDATAAILVAAKSGDYDRVRALLDADPALATATSMLGAQPIHAAHFGGHRHIWTCWYPEACRSTSFLPPNLEP